jgi:predicted RNase H-like HicB family nuclease
MVRDDSGGGAPAWVVWVEELPGCISQGDSPAAASAMIEDAMRSWIGVAIEHGDAIPRPRAESSHSGKMMVRLPSGLHAALDAGARREGVSLNQFMTTLLAGAIGWAPVRSSPAA